MILVESGHRCAIPTCKQTQIEVHHIIPWEKCKSHQVENFIALCPNCHTRVHSGEIDRKSLAIYKANLARRSDTESESKDHGAVSSGVVKISREDAKVHLLTVQGNITISVGGWINDVDSMFLKISGAGKFTTTWEGFTKLPFAEGFCFEQTGLAVVEIAHYFGEVVFKPVLGGTTWNDDSNDLTRRSNGT